VTPTRHIELAPGAFLESRRKLFWLFAALALLLDQLTKLWLWRPPFSPDRPLVLIPGLLQLISHPGNTRGALGFGPSNAMFYVVPAVLGLVVMVYFLLTTSAGNGLAASALGLLAGGDVGNLIDRLALHHVRDFIDLHWGDVYHWSTFNVADSAICVGFAIIVFDVLFPRGRAEPAGEGGEAAPQSVKEGPAGRSSP
jgi:signal peptidase II